tara:strand:- start:305 stop:727 length:423 start_codon:yes stop_codon:yes gene_type:complete
MKIKGLNNRDYKLQLHKYIVKNNDPRPRSKFHLSARKMLNDIYGIHWILEEVKLPGSRNKGLKSTLFLDFFVPHVKLAVEVHGKQHYEYCGFFHKSMAGFKESLKRDNLKQDWCELNEISLIVLKYSDDVETWREQIEQF